MTDDMQLPPGKTCGDCVNWEHCFRFIHTIKPTNTRCDWSPSAFRERTPATCPWEAWKPARDIQ